MEWLSEALHRTEAVPDVSFDPVIGPKQVAAIFSDGNRFPLFD